MLFQPTNLAGVRLIDLEPATDERGFFARTFCSKEFSALGLETGFVQHSLSYTARKGSVRGMHFQKPPHREVKLLHCVKGAIYDVSNRSTTRFGYVFALGRLYANRRAIAASSTYRSASRTDFRPCFPIPRWST